MRIALIALLFSAPLHALSAPIIHQSDRLVLQDLGPGMTPTAINDSGQVVGQDANGVAFIWHNGTTFSLGTLGGAQSYANDINNNGKVVGWSLASDGRMQSTEWTESAGQITIQNLDAASTFEGSAEAINNNNVVVGWRIDEFIRHSVMWDQYSPKGGLLFQNADHIALGINDKGDIVGINMGSDGKPYDGYYWNSTDSPANETSVIGAGYFPYGGINNSGLTVGEEAKSADLFKIGESTTSGIPRINTDPVSSRALGLNEAGLIVGYFGDRGFIYDSRAGQVFDVSNFDFTSHEFQYVMGIEDINNNGQFVGTAWASDGPHGIIGSLIAIPEPSTLSLLVFAPWMGWRFRGR